jgi:hypothetical protein
VNEGTFNNLIVVIVCSFTDLGGRLVVDVARVVCFGVDGVTIFQGLKTSVIVQFMNKHNHFIVGIHYMAHQCNLAVQAFSFLSLVTKIEAF